MPIDNQQLTAALADAETGIMPGWLWRPLLQHLAQGNPVAVADLAAATGKTTGQVRDALAAMPDTEYDEDGRILGTGLTLRPTPHRFEVDGNQLYTWCALDTLIFPLVLDRPARVSSPCHATGAPISLTVHPDKVTALDPVTTVVSLRTPQEGSTIRPGFCNQVHFFASADTARPWLDQHPGAGVLPVAAAFELGRDLAATMLTDPKLRCGC